MTKIGRPPKYRAEYAKQAQKLCRFGATNQDLADFFEVTSPTIWHWANEHLAFFNALKLGKSEADERVMRSLYQKAVGYTYESKKIIQDREGNVIRIPTREHVPPSDTAAIFWLKNRRPDEWRDKQALTGSDGGPMQIEVVHRIVDPKVIDGGELETVEDATGLPK